jgi:hypothetical protein
MSDESHGESQILIPPSFTALYVPPGRTRPTAARAEIAARYDLCEDLAHLLTEHASQRLFELGVAEADVLRRMHRGLLTGEAGVTPVEAGWVLHRLAELLGWPDPAFVDGASERPDGG